MLKKKTLNHFVSTRIAPHFPEFHIYQGVALIRLCRPLIHGIVFERSQWNDDFYVTCIVDFLTRRKDHLAIGFGERMRRCDEAGDTFWVDPAEEEAEMLLEAMRRSQFSPFNLKPTCKRVVELANMEEKSANGLFDLGTCAIFENDPGLARECFSRAKERIGEPEYDWDAKLLSEINELESGLHDLAAIQMKLRRWVEESIRMLGLEKLG